jgi:hypothetical protein
MKKNQDEPRTDMKKPRQSKDWRGQENRELQQCAISV